MPDESKIAAGIWSTDGLEHAAARVDRFLDELSAASTLRIPGLTTESLYARSGVLTEADLVYVVCHGTPDGPVTAERTRLEKERCQWGAGRLRWLVLDACGVLAGDNALEDWAPAFGGLRYLLGFNNDTVDRDHGARGAVFARYLNTGLPIAKAWQWASQETNPWLHEDPAHGDWRPSPAWIRQSTPTDDSTMDRWRGTHAPFVGSGTEREHWATYRYVERVDGCLSTGPVRSRALRGGRAPIVSRGKLRRWWTGAAPRRELRLGAQRAKELADAYWWEQGEVDLPLRRALVSVSRTQVRNSAEPRWRTIALNVTYRAVVGDRPVAGPEGQAEVTIGVDDEGQTSVLEAFRID